MVWGLTVSAVLAASDGGVAAFDRAAVLDAVAPIEVRLLELNDDDTYEVFGDGAMSFGMDDHKAMVAQIGEMSGRCTDQLMAAQWHQDILRQASNEAHFDNCAFVDGTDYIAALAGEVSAARQRYLEAKTLKEKEEFLNAAMESLGRALHATQDFYSHSNFLELMDAQGTPASSIEDIQLPTLWNEGGKQTLLKLVKDHRLHSGTWPLPPFGSRKCVGKTESHGELAKDSVSTSTGKKQLARHPRWAENHYYAAHLLAERASLELIRAVLPKELVAACGARLGILVMHDGRK